MAIDIIDQAMPQIELASNERELMNVEAAAASAYWSRWAAINVRWVRRDEPLVPRHWRSYGGRASPLTDSPRQAATPVNGLLNLAYAIGEVETRISCLAMGLDPGLGVLHADQKARDSLALDVLEAIRPDIDEYILGLLRTAVLRRHDLYETRQGVVRILPPLSHRIAETAPMWAARVAPVVEHVAATFATSSPYSSLSLPTLLTQARRSSRFGSSKPQRISLPAAPSICEACGAPVPRSHRLCARCRPREKLAVGLLGLAAGRARRATLRDSGQDPSTSATANAKRRETHLRRRAEQMEWDRTTGTRVDTDEYWHTVLPAIAHVPVRQLARITGLSVGYCAFIRRGLRVPHPRWWGILREAGKEASSH
jgi:hypothetical protein